MDNLYGKKLPSEILPTVSESDYVVVETRGGALKWIDASGVRTLLDIDSAFPIGSIVYRADDVSPASYLGGSWNKIAEGQTIIGASSAYSLNSSGGSADAVVVAHYHDLYTWNTDGTSYSAVTVGSGNSYGVRGQIEGLSAITGSPLTTFNAGVDGIGKNMQPYVAKNIWQRIN